MLPFQKKTSEEIMIENTAHNHESRKYGKLTAIKILILEIIKTFIARFIFVIFCFVAVWRVTLAWKCDHFWFLLFTLAPLSMEGVWNIVTDPKCRIFLLTKNKGKRKNSNLFSELKNGIVSANNENNNGKHKIYFKRKLAIFKW